MAQRKVNWFAAGISIAVVVVLVLVVVLVVWMNNSNSGSGVRPDGSGIDSETGAVVVGEGTNSVDLWFDFYCPHCQDFEKEYGSTVDDLLEQGDITLNLFPVALAGLNAASGTDFSKRSANALYCVAEAEPDAAYPFMQQLFATNPSGPGQTDEELIAMASSVGATGIDECVTDRTYFSFVEDQTTQLPTNPATGSAGTPTVIVNGEFITLTGDPEADLAARVR